MHPQTPKNTGKKQGGLTPSFTFGSLAALPSAFRFVSPRNMNLLSSFSPHRLFTRFCKNPDETAGKTVDLQQGHSQMIPLQSSALGDAGPGSIPESIMTPFTERVAPSFHNESASELVATADSVDIWSFASETHAVNMNLTAITEAADDKDIFFSPHEMFLEQSPMESDFSVLRASNSTTLDPKNEKNVKKRSLSNSQDSPCSKVASQASILGSPPRPVPAVEADPSDRKKVWTKLLDNELLRCSHKLKSFRSTRGLDESIFKGTSRNKIILRMLERKTGVFRTHRQVSSRLLKLSKVLTPAPRLVVEPAAESTPMKQANRSSQGVLIPTKVQDLQPTGSLDTLNMAFRYKDSGERDHVFAAFSQNQAHSYKDVSPDAARQILPQKNKRLLADFDATMPDLRAHEVDIHNVYCNLNLRPQLHDSSSPVSPMTNPRQFVAENGTFVAYLSIMLRGDLFSKSFVTLKSQVAVYKNTDQVLFKSEESINGYREAGKGFRVEVPFLSHFWAGFLTYIVSGTSDHQDLENLVILQTICDDSTTPRKIYAYMVYRFSAAASGPGNARVEVLRLPKEGRNSEEVDELETILASSPFRSSPFKSPPKAGLRVRTDMEINASGPNNIPTFNSGLLHENNVNYEFAKIPSQLQHQRPAMAASKSTTNFNFEKRPASNVLPHANHSFSLGTRHHSAGQMGAFNPSTPLSENSFCSQPMTGQFPQMCSHPNMIQTPMSMNAMGPVYGSSQAQAFQNGPQLFTPQGPPSGTIRGPWPIATNYHIPQEISSAPASQLNFFPKDVPFGAASAKRPKSAKNQLKFQTMLQYDPSQDKTPEPEPEPERQSQFHTFAVKPLRKAPIVFEAENC